MDRLADIVSGSALALLATVYYVGTRDLPEGPAFFPELLSAALLVLGVTIVCRAIRGKRPGAVEVKPWPIGLMGLTVAYAITFTHIGFLASAFAYTGAVSFLLGQRGVRLALVAITTTAAIYLFLGLGASLP